MWGEMTNPRLSEESARIRQAWMSRESRSAVRLGEFLLDERDPLLREGLVGEEAADVMAQSLVGRQPSGGGVGLRQEAHGLELDHDVAQGRRRGGDPPGLAERPRAHRPAVPDEALDDESQDLLILVAQYRLRHPSSGAFYSIKPERVSND